MAYVNLDEHFARLNGQNKPYEGANVAFKKAYPQNTVESQKAGRLICDEIDTIEVQYPGGDLTARKVEERDKIAYKELWDAYVQGHEPPTQGTPLIQWTPLPRNVCEELMYLKFKTVEQLAQASDDVKRKLGPLQKWCKLAKDWLKAAESDQNEIVTLRQRLEREEKRSKKLEEQVELLMRRVESNEGTRLSESPRSGN